MKPVDLLKEWLANQHKLPGCNDPDCIVCKEQNELISKTEQFIREQEVEDGV